MAEAHQLSTDIRELQKECYGIAKANGWWEGDRNDGEMIALMHSELSEALEALRDGNWNGDHGVAEEMADCVIRILDFCGGRDIDLFSAIEKKCEKNKSRGYKHGGRNF